MYYLLLHKGTIAYILYWHGLCHKNNNNYFHYFPLSGIESPLTLSSQLTEWWAKFRHTTKCILYLACLEVNLKYNGIHHSIIAFVTHLQDIAKPRTTNSKRIWCNWRIWCKHSQLQKLYGWMRLFAIYESYVNVYISFTTALISGIWALRIIMRIEFGI